MTRDIVLSGYFVGGSVVAGLQGSRFIWRRYLSARLTRLWVVLIPALLVTLAADLAGRHANPGAYAGGLRDQFVSGPTVTEPAALDVLTFLGNLGFLQTVAVPVYGSNGPVWMLANMFWYYVLFALLAVGAWEAARFICGRGGASGSPSARPCLLAPVSCLFLFLLLVWWLPASVLMGGLVWLMGVAVWWVVGKAGEDGNTGPGTGDGGTGHRALRIARGWPLKIGGGVAFLAALAASKTGHWFGSDYAVGGAFALWMLGLASSWRSSGWPGRLVGGLAEISYTLYVVHFPILFLVAAVWLNGRQFEPELHGFTCFVALAAAVLMFAAGMWWLFERNTGRVRKVVWKGWGGGG